MLHNMSALCTALPEMLFLTEGAMFITSFNGKCQVCKARFPRMLDVVLPLLQSIGFLLFITKDVSFSTPRFAPTGGC